MIEGLRDEAGRAGNPAGLEGEEIGGAFLEAGGVGLEAVGAVVAATVGDDVKFAVGVVAGGVIALAEPAPKTGVVGGLAVAVIEEIRAGAFVAQLDVVEEFVDVFALGFHEGNAELPELDIFQDEMAVADHVEMEFAIIGGRAVGLEFVVAGDVAVGFEGGLSRFVAVAPRGGKAEVGPGIHQFHAAAAALGQLGPVAAGVVIDFADEIAEAVEEAEEFALVAEAAFEIAEQRNVSVGRAHPVGVGGDDEVAAGGEHGAFVEGEIDAFAEAPEAQVHAVVAAVEEFDELAFLLAERAVEHDFVDDNVAVARRVVGLAARGINGGVPFVGAIGEGLPRVAVRDGEAVTVEDGVGTVDEVDRDGVGFERERDGGRRERVRGERAGEGDAVGEVAFAGEEETVERGVGGAGIEEFDPVDGVAGGEVEFVQAHGGGERGEGGGALVG